MISAEIQDTAHSLSKHAALRLKLFHEEKEAVLPEDERIPAWRTIKSFLDIYALGEKERL